MPAPSNAAADGCMTTDTTADYETLACTRPTANQPVVNACGYPTTKPVITGPRIPPAPAPLDCTASMTAGSISNYARRCHRLTGLTPGDTIQFRWRFTSDPATEFRGFYLDDIAVTNVRVPNVCATPGAAVPVLTGVATRTTHGPAGPFDAAMPFIGSGVEPRSTGGNYTAVLKFDRPMQSGTVAITSGTATAGAPTFSGNDMFVPLSGVADQQRLTLTATDLTSVNGGVLPSASIQMGFLIGDTTGNGEVNATDVSQAKSQSGATTNGSNFRLDVTRNGAINSSDISIIKQRSGNVLPPPAP
jgi:hypothetical protein